MRKLVKEKRKNKQKDLYKIVEIPEKNLSIYGKKIRWWHFNSVEIGCFIL